MNFVGSKGGSGIAKWIISHMPAHRVYCEAFLGRGVVFKTKLPASSTVLIERDPKVICDYWRKEPFYITKGDALSILPALKTDSNWLVYADPPYLGSVRSQKGREYYDCELLSAHDHLRLLRVLKKLPCPVMLSGYDSPLYRRELAKWRVDSKWTVNRRGVRVQEFLWMNFQPPIFYHDSRFMGSDFTDRQAIKRKVIRWQRKFLTLPADHRAAVLDGLSSVVDRK